MFVEQVFLCVLKSPFLGVQNGIFEFSTTNQVFYFSTLPTYLSTSFLMFKGFLSYLNVNIYTFLSKKVVCFKVFNTCGKLLWETAVRGVVRLHKKLHSNMCTIQIKGRFFLHFVVCGCVERGVCESVV